MSIRAVVLRNNRMARELGQGIVLLAITGTSVGGFLGMLAIATRALGR